jgi:hypothetical protein
LNQGFLRTQLLSTKRRINEKHGKLYLGCERVLKRDVEFSFELDGLVMSDAEKSLSDADKYSQTMKDSKSELTALQMELQSLMVKFGLRALHLYQTGTPVPLKPAEMTYLIKYELDNAVRDLAEPSNIDAIIKQTKLEWEKQQTKRTSI